MIASAVKVSFLALCVIFLVLGILIGIIQALVHLIPSAPAAAPSPKPAPLTPQASASGEEEELIAVIQTALAHYLGRQPDQLQITDVRSLS
ncbi:MAG: OadG family protein [Nitrospinaceae bacterium]